MSKLSQADETRILNALDDVRRELDTGSDPNDAITKVASDYQMRPEFVQLMVNAVNTGRTNQQRQDADGDPFKAAADFSVADPTVILERLFPTKVKTAAAAHRESVVSDEYSSASATQRFWCEKAAADKRANITIDWTKLNGETIKKPLPYPTPVEDLMKKAAGVVERGRQRVDNTRREAAQVFDKVANAIDGLVEYFSSIYSLPFAEVSANAKKMYGEKVAGLLKMVESQLPTKVKQASPNFNRAINHEKAPYKTIRECLAYSAEYSQKRAAYNLAVKEASAEAEKALRPFVVPPVVTGSVLEEGTSWFHKIGAATGPESTAWRGLGVMDTLSRARDIGSAYSKQWQQKAQDKITNELLDPAHDAELRNIQAQAMLTKLISGPFSRYEPEDVMEAYNRVSPFIPEAAQHEALIQDALHKQLAGGHNAMDIFTIGQLADINKKMRDSREPSDVQARMLGLGSKPKKDEI